MDMCAFVEQYDITKSELYYEWQEVGDLEEVLK